jgi:hypothetical protein
MKKKTIREFIKLPIDDLFEQVIQEGVHDKAIFKAVFLAGGPGSGKDYVLDNTLSGHGLTEINSDKALEYLMDREGLDKRMPKSEEDARNILRGAAKTTTEVRQRLALQGRNGLIINGTGDDPEKIKKIKDRLEELGYESSMVMVNTEDEVSMKRNIERGQRGGRTVPEKIRKEKWDSVQAARPEFAKLFGSNYAEFENSADLKTAPKEVVDQKKEEMLGIYKNIKGFVAAKPSNEKAQSWIAQELQSKDSLKVNKSDLGKLPNDYSQQSQDEKSTSSKASQMGLQYLGYGRYGKNHKVTHRVVNGKLVEVPKEPIGQGKRVPITGSSMSAKNASTPKETSAHTHSVVPTKAKNVLTTLKQKETQKEDINTSFSELFSEENNNVELTSKQLEKMHLLKDLTGKVRVFMIRRAATEYANQKGGVVYKAPRGYVIKLKEEINHVNIRENFEPVQSTTDGRTKGSRINEQSCSCEACNKKSFAETKKTLKAKINEIDFGTETGVSMSGTGENPSRGSLSTRAKKAPFDEMTGDETGMSIGDQKELEMRNQGITLSTFKAKKVV